MLPRRGVPLPPCHVALRGPPEPVFPALPTQLSLTAISKKIITPRSHTYGTSYLQNIYFNMCQGLLRLQAEPRPHIQAAGVELSSQRTAGQQKAGWAAHTRAVGLGWGTLAMPRASVGPPWALGGRGLLVPCVPGCSCVVTAVEQLPVLCCLSQGPARKQKPHEVFQQREFNIGRW